ncbi:hypothetical protein BIY24_15730 [Halobacteriovorax marinus]|uniref:hypothetical protein n=1 Tax=Halobacteriovorax marinus TaxID=97084 RepID=UPI000BC3330A|nr:hypothetical protein [Halobacteriovorax marinus]ATH09337.1 hypothetical protein BIY24_15730 [Halobacteriovorax marinus]
MKNTLLLALAITLTACGSSGGDSTPGSVINPANTTEGKIKAHLASGYSVGLIQTTTENGEVIDKGTNTKVCDYNYETVSTLIDISGSQYTFHVKGTGNQFCDDHPSESIEVKDLKYLGSYVDFLLEAILENNATYKWNDTSKVFTININGQEDNMDLKNVKTYEHLTTEVSPEGEYSLAEYKTIYTIDGFTQTNSRQNYDVESLKDQLGYCTYTLNEKKESIVNCVNPKQ